MFNVQMENKNNKLVITVDLTKEAGSSKSGKSIVIASTLGNVSIPDTNSIKIGLNVYRAVLQDNSPVDKSGLTGL